MSIVQAIQEGRIYEAHQLSLSKARRLRKKDPSKALNTLLEAIRMLSPHEDTLEIAKYALVMAKEDNSLTPLVVDFCVDATLAYCNQFDFLTEWDKVCNTFNTQLGKSVEIPTAFALKYLSLGLIEEAICHIDHAPLSVLKEAIKVLKEEKLPGYKKQSYGVMIPLCVRLLRNKRCGALLTILEELPEEKPFQILEAMARAYQGQLDKKCWIQLRMYFEQTVGQGFKRDLDMIAHEMFGMPMKKQMNMQDMLKGLLG